jgi:hypothetical protein
MAAKSPRVPPRMARCFLATKSAPYHLLCAHQARHLEHPGAHFEDETNAEKPREQETRKARRWRRWRPSPLPSHCQGPGACRPEILRLDHTGAASQSKEGRAEGKDAEGLTLRGRGCRCSDWTTARGMLTHLTGARVQSPSRRPIVPGTAMPERSHPLARAILRPTTRQRSILDQGRRREGGVTGTPRRGQAPPRVTTPAISGPILRCPRSPTLLLATGPSWRWHRRLPGGAEIS